MACFQREWTLIKRTAFIYVGPCYPAPLATYSQKLLPVKVVRVCMFCRLLYLAMAP